MVTFLTLYGGMHIYAFIRLIKAFRPKFIISVLLMLWMILMTIIPLLVHGAEQSGKEDIALFLAWPGYLWMGFIFIYSSLLFFIEIVLYGYRTVNRCFSGRSTQYCYPSGGCKVAFTIAIVASIYAFFEAGQIHADHVVITSPKLLAITPKIRIVQISDVHIGLLQQDSRFKKMLETIREATPDILISTGDLIDGKLNRDYGMTESDPIIPLIAAVPAPLGKFAIIGNHEVYAGLRQAIAFSQAAGFNILRNQSVELQCGLTITGIDDKAVKKNERSPASESYLLDSATKNSFKLLLKHRPEILPESDGRFDLQLSGHTHGGQIFPFNLLVKLKHFIPCGTTTTQKGSRIHVSRGTGTWGPPMRLFAPPEITIIDLVSPAIGKK